MPKSQGGVMLSFKVLTLIISLCNITSVEDNRSNWTELKNVEKYQLECRIWYMDCAEKDPLDFKEMPNDRIVKCMRKRWPK